MNFAPQSQYRLADDARAWLQFAVAPGTEVEYLAAELVTEHERIGAGGHDRAGADLAEQFLHVIAMVAHVQVGTADAAALDADQDLAGSGNRVGKIYNTQLGVLANNGFHAKLQRVGNISERMMQCGPGCCIVIW